MTGFGQKEKEGIIFSDDVGKQGEWINFDKGVMIVLSELPLNPDKTVRLCLDGIPYGDFVFSYKKDSSVIELMAIKSMVLGEEGI